MKKIVEIVERSSFTFMSEISIFDKEVLAKAQIFAEKHAFFRKTFTLSEAEYVIQNYRWYDFNYDFI